MKKLSLLFAVPLLLLSCKNTATEEGASSTEGAAAPAKEVLTYAYQPTYSINWKPGDEKLAQMVLQALKNYCDGDIDACMTVFADSVETYFDGFHFLGTRDSLAALFRNDRKNYSSITPVMDTWLVTYYPDQEDSWVTLWYKEKTSDTKGNQDSIYCTDDLLIKNGKIKMIDQKVRHYAKK